MKIAIVCHRGQTSGYPVAARALRAALEAAGHKVDAVEHGGQPLFYHLAIHLVAFMEPAKLLPPPCRNVVYTMTESSEFPDWAAKELSKYDAVATPTRFNADALARRGIEAVVSPLGFDRTLWPPIAPRRFTRRPYRVLCVAHSSRKAPETFAEAYHLAFGDDPTVRGVIKGKVWTATPGIEVVGNGSSLADHQALIDSCDMAVVCSLGEGASLMPLEYLSRGLVTIVANNTAHLDYPENMFYRARTQTEVPARMYKTFYEGSFFRSDPAELALMMRRLRRLHGAGDLVPDIAAQQQHLALYDARRTAVELLDAVAA